MENCEKQRMTQAKSETGQFVKLLYVKGLSERFIDWERSTKSKLFSFQGTSFETV